MQEVFDMEDFIAENISSLNDYEQAMIIDRYIHGKSWKRICSEYNYAYDEKHNSAYNIVSKALKKLWFIKVIGKNRVYLCYNAIVKKYKAIAKFYLICHTYGKA